MRLRRLAQNAAVRRIYQPEEVKYPINNPRFVVPPLAKKPPQKRLDDRVTNLEIGFNNVHSMVSDFREEFLSSIATNYDRSHREAKYISSQISSLHELVENLSRTMRDNFFATPGIITRNQCWAKCDRVQRTDVGAANLGSGDSVLTNSTTSNAKYSGARSRSSSHYMEKPDRFNSAVPVITVIVDSLSLRSNCNVFSDRVGLAAPTLIIKMGFLGLEPDGNEVDFQPGLLFDRPKRPDDIVPVNKFVGTFGAYRIVTVLETTATVYRYTAYCLFKTIAEIRPSRLHRDLAVRFLPNLTAVIYVVTAGFGKVWAWYN